MRLHYKGITFDASSQHTYVGSKTATDRTMLVQRASFRLHWC